MDKVRIDVSPEMLSFVGPGCVPSQGWPAQAVGLAFRLGEGRVAFHDRPLDADALEDADVVFVVADTACHRIFGRCPDADEQWHLPEAMRVIALAILDCALTEPARATFRLAKSIELLCAVFTALADDSLVVTGGACELSELDARRIVAARRHIDEQWQQKLTLDSIARTCGLNRAKLTRGFRAMFDCTVAEAIADRRLSAARQMLLASELPVSSIGYRCGYLNNASFTRAFARRYGSPPSLYRGQGLAA